MKIVHLCLSSTYVDNYNYQNNVLPKYHKKMGYEVSMIASVDSLDSCGKECLLNPSEYVTNDGFKIIRIDYRKNNRRFNKRLRRYIGLYAVLEKETPDILFIHNCQFWDIGIVVDFLKKNQSVVVYVDNHADYINSARNRISYHILHKLIWKHCAQKILPYTKKFFGVLPVRCDFLHEMYNIPREKIELLIMGVDDDEIPSNRNLVRAKIRNSLNISDKDFLIITGGKIDSRKNIHNLLEAFDLLGRKNVHLIIFGIIQPEMERICSKLLDSNKNIHYVGWLNSTSVMEYLVASDLGCFPGTHSTLWEQSVGVGLPCIFNDWQGMHHVDVNNNCAFTNGNNSNSILKSIITVLDETYDVLSKNASIVASKFRYSQIARQSLS